MIVNTLLETANTDTLVGAFLGAAMGLLIFICILFVAIIVLYIIGLWKTFKKAGEPGWAAIIPFYNLYVLVKISKLEWFHFVILLALDLLIMFGGDGSLGTIVTFGYLGYSIFVYINTAKAFGRSAGLGVVCGLFPFVGFMILGCGNAEYQK